MIHLIVGNTGSGKTTYAKRLKNSKRGVMFSIDNWNKTLFFPDKLPDSGLEWFLERIDRSETLIMELLPDLESAGTDSILDLGFSRFQHREKFRAFALAHGFKFSIHFLDIPSQKRYQRIQERNKVKGETFHFEVSRQDFEFMETYFENPTALEMEKGILITE